MPSRKIAVISDTHDHVPRSLPRLLAQADEIWHLGDVCEPFALSALQSLALPLILVRGNCDANPAWPITRVLERAGYRFQLQHLPPRTAPAQTVDAILHGHVHRPQQDDWQGIRILCPGAITGPRGGSQACFAWLGFPEAGGWTWEYEPIEE